MVSLTAQNTSLMFSVSDYLINVEIQNSEGVLAEYAHASKQEKKKRNIQVQTRCIFKFLNRVFCNCMYHDKLS